MLTWLGKLALIVAVAFLILVAGGAAIYFSVTPGPQLERSFQAWEAVRTRQRQQRRTLNAGGVYPVEHNFQGVTRADPSRWQEGYTVYSTAQGQAVSLVNMQGHEVHRWEFSYDELWDEESEVQNLVPERFIYVRNAHLYPNGDLLLSFSAWTTTPFGFGIARVDRDSNLIWKNFRHIHHSFDEAEDGTVYALDHIVIDEPPAWLKTKVDGPYLDDGVAIFTSKGEFLKRISLLESLKSSSYWPVITSLALSNAGNNLGDWLHANDVEVLTSDDAAAFPFAEAGDLLISMREVSAIAILNVEQEKVTWLARGDWFGQHDPDFLSNGNILLFNNIDMQTDSAGTQTSSIIEINPKTRAVVWSYKGTEAEPFFTSARGSQQRLPNGNTLITESQGGRIIEVTMDGDIVWEFYNPDRHGEPQPRLPSIFWATRHPAETINFDFNQPVGLADPASLP
jgi:hypothetical protein